VDSVSSGLIYFNFCPQQEETAFPLRQVDWVYSLHRHRLLWWVCARECSQIQVQVKPCSMVAQQSCCSLVIVVYMLQRGNDGRQHREYQSGSQMMFTLFIASFVPYCFSLCLSNHCCHTVFHHVFWLIVAILLFTVFCKNKCETWLEWDWWYY
jgi:hypothetical protein